MDQLFAFGLRVCDMTIQEFPLAWRWTQASHALLPQEVLERLRPLNPEETQRFRKMVPLVPVSVASHDTKDSPNVHEWLRRLQPDAATVVYVCWSEELGIESTWDIFMGYWADFCYPSSDEVTVVPASANWRLIYHHYEQFDFVTTS